MFSNLLNEGETEEHCVYSVANWHIKLSLFFFFFHFSFIYFLCPIFLTRILTGLSMQTSALFSGSCLSLITFRNVSQKWRKSRATLSISVSRKHVGRNWRTTLDAHSNCSTTAWMKWQNGKVLLQMVNVQLLKKIHRKYAKY